MAIQFMEEGRDLCGCQRGFNKEKQTKASIILLPTFILNYHCMTTMKGIHNTKMNVNTNPNIGQIANPKPILTNESD